MAEDFKSLIKEQQETNKKLDQLVELADPEGAAKAQDAAAKEEANKKAAGEKKTQNLLKKMATGITGLAKSWAASAKAKLKGLGGGLIKFLKGTALAGMMIALLAFLNSETWKKMKENIVKFIDDPSFSNFFAIFAPAGKWSIIAAVGGLALLFGPVRTAMLAGGLLYKGIKGFTGMFLKGGLISRGLASLTGLVRRTFGPKKPPAVPKTGLPGTGADKKGQYRDPKTGRFAKAPTPTGGGRFAKVGAGLLRGAAGAARFLGPIGLAVTAVMGVVDGVTAGMEEAKKENSTNLTIMREASAGVISGLTFGLISQETISKAFTSVGCKFDEMSAGVVKVTKKAWQGVKDLIPTEEKLKEKFTTLKNDLAPLTEIKLPKEISFSALKDSVGTMATALNASFKNITGIDVSAKLSGIKDTVSNKAAALVCSFENITGMDVSATLSGIKDTVSNKAADLVCSFENITGIDVNATLTSIKTGVADTAKRLTSSFENITGLTVPKSFAEAQSMASKALEDVGCLVSDKFTELTGLTMPTFGDVQTKLSDLGTRVSGSFTDLTGITLPSFADIGTKLESLLPNIQNPFAGVIDSIKKSDFFKDARTEWSTWAPIKSAKGVILNAFNSIFGAKAMGGPIKQGLPYLVGEMGPELILPSGSGQVLNANRTEQILASGITRGMQGMGGGTNFVNAPVQTVNNSQSNTTVTSTELTHPSKVLNAVNLAA